VHYINSVTKEVTFELPPALFGMDMADLLREVSRDTRRRRRRRRRCCCGLRIRLVGVANWGRDPPTGAGEDNGIAQNQNWLRFPYDSTFLRSHYLHPHPYAVACSGHAHPDGPRLRTSACTRGGGSLSLTAVWLLLSAVLPARPSAQADAETAAVVGMAKAREKAAAAGGPRQSDGTEAWRQPWTGKRPSDTEGGGESVRSARQVGTPFPPAAWAEIVAEIHLYGAPLLAKKF
jgi:hypothetical protein